MNQGYPQKGVGSRPGLDLLPTRVYFTKSAVADRLQEMSILPQVELMLQAGSTENLREGSHSTRLSHNTIRRVARQFVKVNLSQQ